MSEPELLKSKVIELAADIFARLVCDTTKFTDKGVSMTTDPTNLAQLSFKLAGVEYILPIGSSPPPQGTTPPKLFGQDFNITDATGFFGTPTFLWTLHVWIWKPNPAGVFASWNTRVTCD